MSKIAFFAPIAYSAILVAAAFSCTPQYFQSTQKNAPKRLTLEDLRNARVERLADNWAPAPDFSSSLNALAQTPTVAAAHAVSLYDKNDDYWGLPRTDGYELVAAYCSACHTLEIVMQQRMTPSRWDFTLNWMTEKQGMIRLDADDEEIIETYLNRHFSTETR